VIAAAHRHGYDDVTLKWDISTSQTVVARLIELPGQGEMRSSGRSRKLFAERDAYSKGWQHLLGDRHTMIVYSTLIDRDRLIRRLEVQAHFGNDGIDNLCAVEDFKPRYDGLIRRMAVYGVLPVEEPRVVRVDPAVDVVYPDERDGQKALEAVKAARWPKGWYTEYAGAPPYTTVNVKSRGGSTKARVYCRNTKEKVDAPRWGKLRYEVQHRYDWASSFPVTVLENPVFGSLMWGHVFGAGQASGKVTRYASEELAMNLIEKVALGEMGYAQYERMNAFLTAERLGLVDKAYTPEQARSRRREAKLLGLSAADVEYPDFDESLDEILAPARAAWAVA
jgi:hypothetical protein